MVEPSRYNVSQSQAELENGILKNKLAIKDQKELDQAETIFLVDAYGHFLSTQRKEGLNFNLELIFKVHYEFLNKLYDWAGTIRSVDISKDNFLFCPTVHIKNNLASFEAVIEENIPKKDDLLDDIALNLAIIHNEFNVIHPFRDGNGRTIRLFLDILLDSIGYEGLDYGNIDIDDYFSACKAGVMTDHEPMKKLFMEQLTKI